MLGMDNHDHAALILRFVLQCEVIILGWQIVPGNDCLADKHGLDAINSCGAQAVQAFKIAELGLIVGLQGPIWEAQNEILVINDDGIDGRQIAVFPLGAGGVVRLKVTCEGEVCGKARQGQK